jgi:hypothetical protein
VHARDAVRRVATRLANADPAVIVSGSLIGTAIGGFGERVIAAAWWGPPMLAATVLGPIPVWALARLFVGDGRLPMVPRRSIEAPPLG